MFAGASNLVTALGVAASRGVESARRVAAGVMPTV